MVEVYGQRVRQTKKVILRSFKSKVIKKDSLGEKKKNLWLIFVV